MPDPATSPDHLLELKGLTKQYPGTLAVDHVSLSVKRGSVHALVGENGAGKSTLIKMLSGAVTPTEGTIVFDGQAYAALKPDEALDLGIGVIYQEFNLVPELSVASNIFLGREFRHGVGPVPGPFVDDRKAEAEARSLIEGWDVSLDPARPVARLSIAEKQIVEIIKAISLDVKLLVMDEPTATLTLDEVRTLYRLTRQLQERGVTIIYISHRLEEIFDVCDTISVLRDGKHVGTVAVADVTETDLIRMMVGRELGAFPKKAPPQDEVLLSVRHLSDGDMFEDVSFDLHRGEILGIYALIGAGRTDVAMTIFGAKKRTRGEIQLRGVPVVIPNPTRAVKLGLGLVPEDRKGQGLVLSMRAGENMTLSIIEELFGKRLIRRKKEQSIIERFQTKLRMQPHVPREEARNLSGGTQQKVVIAKILARQADVILFDEPTRGIDVGAKREIYELMIQLCDEGRGILMISSEMPELLGMADRILVMRKGRLMGEFSREEATEEILLSLAAGRTSAAI